MIYLFFNTQSEAITAIAQIDSNMDLPNENTTTWAEPRLSLQNTWGFAKPDSVYMNNVTGHTELEYDFNSQYYIPEEY
jgi:hypothetical protein